MRITRLIATAVLLFMVACTDAEENVSGNQQAIRTATAEAASGVRILPMSTMIRQFQAAFPTVSSFGEDAPATRDELIARFAAAVADSNVSALRSITINAAEFAYLYFPESIYAREPYAQPPTVNWMLLEQNSMKGQARLLRYYGGRRLAVEGHRCDVEPKIESGNHIWQSCMLRIRRSGGETEEVRLFGSIIERDGRFKLLSVANQL